MKFFFIYLSAINLIAFFVSAYDKLAAKRGARRIPEILFPEIAFLGGGAGVLLSFYLIRHKTKKRMLLFLVWSISIIFYVSTFFLIRIFR